MTGLSLSRVMILTTSLCSAHSSRKSRAASGTSFSLRPLKGAGKRRLVVDRGGEHLGKRLHHRRHDSPEQVFLVLEEEVERPGGNPGRGTDLTKRGTLVAPQCELPHGRLEETVSWYPCSQTRYLRVATPWQPPFPDDESGQNLTYRFLFSMK